MTFTQATAMLGLLGIDHGTAVIIVQMSGKMGRYGEKLVSPADGTWRTYTVHHGMRGNTGHYYMIEIS